jgi:YedE family putative selenium metabolism protein
MKPDFFATSRGIAAVGLFIGLAAALLQWWGNPPNMGICIACMERDIAGALGLHRVAQVQYLRPEIMGLVFGALVAALWAGEFQPRTGSSPVIRLFLGIFAMIGALVFLGCPWRVLLRLAGGDLNAVVGLAGLTAGIAAGAYFLKTGYSLGRNHPSPTVTGLMLPLFMLLLLIFLIFQPQFGRVREMTAGGEILLATGPIFMSKTGPASQYAPPWLALIIAGAVGFLAQRSGFCTLGAIRNILFIRDFHLFYGLAALVAAAFAANLLLGQFRAGWEGQPIAHSHGLWNFLGMSLSGLALALAGGCPGRQLILAGEGDGDAAIFVIGMILGAGVAHNFNLASSAAGPGLYGPAATLAGLAFCLFLGFTLREKRA